MQLETFVEANQSFKTEMELHAKIMHFDKRGSTFDYDDTMKHFYILLGGELKIYQINLDNAKEQTIYLMSRGDMYDTVTLLDGKTHDVVVDILEEGEALQIPIGKAREWMYVYPEFGEIILKYISSQLRGVEGLASDLTLLDTQDRLIKLLLKNINDDGNSILDGLSHGEIAKLIGTVRHVVDRHIKQLREDGILEKEKKKISVRNREKLLDKIRRK